MITDASYYERFIGNRRGTKIDDLVKAGFFDLTIKDHLGTNHSTYEFKDSAEFVKYVVSIKPEETYAQKNGYSLSSNERGEDWTMSKDFLHAFELFCKPKSEDIDQVRKITERIDKKVDAMGYLTGRKLIEYDVTGDYLDVGAYLEGVPEVFGHISDTRDVGRYVEIIVEYTANAGVSAEEILDASIALLALIQKLEMMKCRVRVHYVHATDCCFIHFVLKEYTHRISIADLVGSMHPSFFRRLVFRAIENSPNYRSGYGRSDYRLEYKGQMFKHPFVYTIDDLMNLNSDNEKLKFISEQIDIILK